MSKNKELRDLLESLSPEILTLNHIINDLYEIEEKIETSGLVRTGIDDKISDLIRDVQLIMGCRLENILSTD